LVPKLAHPTIQKTYTPSILWRVRAWKTQRVVIVIHNTITMAGGKLLISIFRIWFIDLVVLLLAGTHDQ
jgi:hypothetical protein